VPCVGQIVAPERYTHCAKIMGLFPDYNQLWDLDKCGVFNIYAMLPPDPMHVISGIQLHIISGASGKSTFSAS